MRSRFPDEPYRQRFGFMRARLEQTRRRLVVGDGGTGRDAAGYAEPRELLVELDELRDALIADGLPRVAHGELQDLRWQVESFGFHGLSLEVRQHSSVHAAALEALAAAPRDQPNEQSLGRETVPAGDRPRGPRHVPGDRRRATNVR